MQSTPFTHRAAVEYPVQFFPQSPARAGWSLPTATSASGVAEILFDIGRLRLENPASPITQSHHMSNRVFFWSLTSALAGFLFGFDTVVISGAEQTIQSLWGLGSGLHGVAMAAALYGTVLGALSAAGRRIVLAAAQPCCGSACCISWRPWVLPWQQMSIFSSPRASLVAWASESPRWPRRFTFRKSRRQNIAGGLPACFSSTSSSAS